MTEDGQTCDAAMEGVAPAKGGAGSVLVAALCYVGTFITNLGMMAFVAPAQRLLDELALSKAQFGFVQSAYMAGAVAAMLVLCTRMRRLGDRTGLLLAHLALVGGNALACLGNVSALASARLLIGGAGATCVFVLSRLTFRYFHRRRTLLVGLLHASFLAGSLVSMALGGAWYDYVGSWARLSVGLTVLSALPLAPLLLFCPARRPEAPDDTVRHSLAAVWRPSAYRRAVLAVATYLVGESAMAFFLPLYVQTHLGGSPFEVAAAGTLFLSFLLAGRLLLCALLGGRDELRVLPLLATLAWVLLLAVLLPLPTPLRAVLLATGGFLLGPVAVLEINVGVRVAGGHLDDAIIVTNVMLSMGGIVGGLFIGGVGQAFGLSTAMAVALALSLAAVIPLWRIGRVGLRNGRA